SRFAPEESACSEACCRSPVSRRLNLPNIAHDDAPDSVHLIQELARLFISRLELARALVRRLHLLLVSKVLEELLLRQLSAVPAQHRAPSWRQEPEDRRTATSRIEVFAQRRSSNRTQRTNSFDAP